MVEDLVGPRYRPHARTGPPGVLQASHHPLPDDAALPFGHGCDDREHRLTHRCGSVRSFLVGDEVNAQAAELFQGQHELLDATGEPVEGPDHHHVEQPAPRIRHQGVQAGSNPVTHPKQFNTDMDVCTTKVPFLCAPRRFRLAARFRRRSTIVSLTIESLTIVLIAASPREC